MRNSVQPAISVYFSLWYLPRRSSSNTTYWKLRRLSRLTVKTVFDTANLREACDTFRYTAVLIWSSNVKFESKITPRSLADYTGEMSFPNKDKRNSWSFEVICRLPKRINFVLSGFSNCRFLKHQLRTPRSSFISSTIRWVSCEWKETNNFVSSTLHSVEQFRGASGRSLTYMLNNKEPSMLPWGTPYSVGIGSETVEWIRTTWYLFVR